MTENYKKDKKNYKQMNMKRSDITCRWHDGVKITEYDWKLYKIFEPYIKIAKYDWNHRSFLWYCFLQQKASFNSSWFCWTFSIVRNM